jgi:ParB family chromosome partitioning protein
MLALAREIIARGLSVHATEALVKQPPAEKSEPSKPESGGGSSVEKTPHVLGIENELRQKLGIRFEIKLKARDKGSIVLTFDSGDDFERLVEVLRK